VSRKESKSRKTQEVYQLHVINEDEDEDEEEGELSNNEQSNSVDEYDMRWVNLINSIRNDDNPNLNKSVEHKSFLELFAQPDYQLNIHIINYLNNKELTLIEFVKEYSKKQTGSLKTLELDTIITHLNHEIHLSSIDSEEVSYNDKPKVVRYIDKPKVVCDIRYIDLINAVRQGDLIEVKYLVNINKLNLNIKVRHSDIFRGGHISQKEADENRKNILDAIQSRGKEHAERIENVRGNKEDIDNAYKLVARSMSEVNDERSKNVLKKNEERRIKRLEELKEKEEERSRVRSYPIYSLLMIAYDEMCKNDIPKITELAIKLKEEEIKLNPKPTPTQKKIKLSKEYKQIDAKIKELRHKHEPTIKYLETHVSREILEEFELYKSMKNCDRDLKKIINFKEGKILLPTNKRSEPMNNHMLNFGGKSKKLYLKTNRRTLKHKQNMKEIYKV
jgi:hypothetical protein